jgi:hypothetical protein
MSYIHKNDIEKMINMSKAFPTSGGYQADYR